MHHLIVQKYGGSSVGSPEKIKKVALRIRAYHEKKIPLVVVVSAMGDTTDDLLELAALVSQKRHERELDVLLSSGERIAMALLSMALGDLGVSAISFTGSQAGIITTSNHTCAKIQEIRPVRVKEELEKGKVVIIAGFQGVSTSKEITTLGRGGSDTTAVALASALGAESCEILTDVPGIFSADPRVVTSALRYEEVPLSVMSSLAVLGAQVMHPRSIEIAREKGFSLYVGQAHLSARPFSLKEFLKMKSKSGTMLVPDRAHGLEEPKVFAIATDSELSLFCGETTKDHRFLALLDTKKIPVHGYIQTTDKNSKPMFQTLLSAKESGLAFESFAKLCRNRNEVTAVSLIGVHLHQNPSLVVQVQRFFEKQKVQCLGLTCNPQSITVWVKEHKKLKTLITSLHDQFVLGKKGKTK